MVTQKSFALIALLTGALFSAGCVKKRAVQYSQGQGVDALAINAYDGKVDQLNTQGPLAGTSKSASESPVDLSADMSDMMNRFPLVEYTTTAELLGTDTPVRGRPNFQYEIRYELTENRLRLLKVGKKEDIASDEWTYAVTLKDGKLGIPLVGYPVKYFRVDFAVNEDNKQTRRLIELPVASRSQATHFRIERSGRTIFEALEKIDVFPAQYFKGQWYYQETIVASKIGDENNLGMQNSVDTSLNEASLIRFDLDNKKSLVGININQDERIDQRDRLNQGYVFSIPVEWKEYEAAKDGRDPGLKEQETKHREETKRPYIHVQFDQVTTPSDELFMLLNGPKKPISPSVTEAIAAAFGKLQGSQKLVDLKLTKSFFSFTVLKGSSATKVRYSFRRITEETQAEPRPYNEQDTRVFGYFLTAKKFVWDRHIQRKSDVEARRLMSRFNPRNKEIVYHFSKETPTEKEQYGWVRKVAREAIHFWDQAFQMAGTGIRIRLDESQDVDLGDIRYNVMHIINPLLNQGLYGYGPSLADPRTGEIISATTNIQLTGFLNEYSAEIRSYIKDRLGLFAKNLTGTPFQGATIVARATEQSQQMSGMPGLLAVEVAADGKIKRKPFEIYSFNNITSTEVSAKPMTGYFSSAKGKRVLQLLDGGSEITSVEDSVDRYRRLLQSRTQGQLLTRLADNHTVSAATDKNTERMVRKVCPEVEQFIASNKNSEQISTEQENAVVESCLVKMVPLPMLLTLLHELGHNFSLRHNFACSADQAEFWTAAEIRKNFTGLNGQPFPEEYLPFGEDPDGACVMDYYGTSAKPLPVPGKYEIAAIKFIYGDRVTMADGRDVSVKNSKAANAYIPLADLKLKPYKFCTDEDDGLSIDPMCTKNDLGVTPMQAVDNYIEEYWRSLVNTGYRYGKEYRPGISLENIYWRRARILGQLKRFYDQWRFHMAEFVGQKNQYLERYDVETYQKALEEMANSPLAKEYAAYKPVRDKIANFFLSLAYLSNRYCVGTNTSGSVVATEFSKLQSELALIKRDATVDSCSAPEMVKLLSSRGIQFQGEVGHFLEMTRFRTSVEGIKDYPDAFGVKPDRMTAVALLNGRADASILHAAKSFFPSMMDEPDIRQRVMSLYMNRVMNGLDLVAELSKIPALNGNATIKAPLMNFEAEREPLLLQGGLLQLGLMVPGKAEVNRERASLFFTGTASPNTELHTSLQKQGAVFLPLPNGQLLYATPANAISYAWIKRTASAKEERILGDKGIDSNQVSELIDKIVAPFPASIIEKFTGKRFFTVIRTLAEILNSETVPASTKIAIQRIFGAYMELFSSTGGDQAMQQIVALEQKLRQGRDQLKAMGASEQPSDSDSAEIKTVREQLSKIESSAQQMDQQLNSVDLGAEFKKQKLEVPIVRKQVADNAKAELKALVGMSTRADAQEFDAHVNLLMQLLTN